MVRNSRSQADATMKNHARGNRTRPGSASSADDTRAPDPRYLEVAEEMLKQRQNNGRDREEAMAGNEDT